MAELLFNELLQSDVKRIDDDSLSARLAREGELLGSLKNTLGEGVTKKFFEMWDHKLATAGEATLAFGIGAGLAIASRNPGALRGLAGRLASAAPKIFTAMMAVDGARRVGVPVLDTWFNPENLEANKSALGDNLGSAIIDYGVMGSLGYAGSRVGTGLGEQVAAVRYAMSSKPLHAEINMVADNVTHSMRSFVANARQEGRWSNELPTEQQFTKFNDLLRKNLMHEVAVQRADHLNVQLSMRPQNGQIAYDPAASTWREASGLLKAGESNFPCRPGIRFTEGGQVFMSAADSAGFKTTKLNWLADYLWSPKAEYATTFHLKPGAIDIAPGPFHPPTETQYLAPLFKRPYTFGTISGIRETFRK